MGDVLQFKKRSLAEKYKGRTLCKNGFHKWRIIQEKQFDVKQGRLVTLFQCSRCGETKAEAT